MNILMTGASGFIGSHLAPRLAQAGHTVSGLSRNPEAASAQVPAITKFFPWRPEELPPPEALERADLVIHLAGESVSGRWTEEKKRRIIASRVDGTRNLVSALTAGRGPKALISVSAVGYYGDRGDAELDEQSAPGTGFLTEVTQAWEREALRVEQAGCRVAVMRLGIVLGTSGGALGRLLPLFRLGLGGPLGSGRQWWPWVHIEDVTRAMESAANNEWAGIFNITSPQPVRQRDFAHALGQALHRPAIFPTPAFGLRLILGEFSDELLFSKRVLPAHLRSAGFEFHYPALGPALGQLLSRAKEERKDATVPSHP
jgi:uncharacterized protein (TIGR01777 family)